jgi:hypothetical protein
MRRPTFLEGVTVAVVASLVGSVSHTALSLAFAGDAVLRMLVAGLGLAYIVYLLGRSRACVGRMTAVVAWLLLAGATWLMEPPCPSTWRCMGARCGSSAPCTATPVCSAPWPIWG